MSICMGSLSTIEKPEKKKKGFRAKLQEKYNAMNQELKQEKAAEAKKSKKK